MTRIIIFLLTTVFTYSQATQAADKNSLMPGQVIIEFSSKDNINLYALKAKRIDVLNVLSRYLTIELFTQNQLDKQISIELKQQSLDSVFSRLLGDQNYIVRYTAKTAEEINDSKLRHNKIQTGSIVNAADTIKPNNYATLTKNTSTAKHKRLIEKIEAYGDFKNPDSTRHLPKLNDFEFNSQLLVLTESLGDIGTDKAVNQLAQLSNHDSTKVREAVIYALGDIGSTAAINVLGVAINDANPKLRDLVISELALINNDQSVSRLMKSFNQYKPNQQIKLLKAISETTTAKSKAYLWELVKNENPQISIYAYDLLNSSMQ